MTLLSEKLVSILPLCRSIKIRKEISTGMVKRGVRAQRYFVAYLEIPQVNRMSDLAE